MPLTFIATHAANVAFSNGDRTITTTAGPGSGAGAFLSELVAGKCCFAFEFGAAGGGGNASPGIEDPAASNFSFYVHSGCYIVEFGSGRLNTSSGEPTYFLGGGSFLPGDVLFWVVDEPNNLMWLYKNGALITEGGVGDPAAGTGGVSGYLASGARRPAFALNHSDGVASATVIDDPVAAGITVPSGFTYLGASSPPTSGEGSSAGSAGGVVRASATASGQASATASSSAAGSGAARTSTIASASGAAAASANSSAIWSALGIAAGAAVSFGAGRATGSATGASSGSAVGLAFGATSSVIAGLGSAAGVSFVTGRSFAGTFEAAPRTKLSSSISIRSLLYSSLIFEWRLQSAIAPPHRLKGRI